MNTIQSIAMTLCTTAIATTIFTMLLPKSSTASTVKFAISLFFLVGILTPFLNGGIDFRLDFSQLQPPPAITGLAEQTESSFLSLAQENLAAQAERVALSCGIHPQKVKVSIHIGEQDSISISTIMLLIPKTTDQKVDRLRECLQKEFGAAIQPRILQQEEEKP